MLTFDRRALERLQHYRGQMLRSADLRDQLAFDDQRRWWHNRGVHGAFGVSVECLVTLDPHSQPVMAVVQPNQKTGFGLAYDCFGREIIITREQSVQSKVEDIGKPLTLVARLRQRASDCDGGRPPAVCVGAAPAVVDDRVSFEWIPTSRVTPFDGVPIARIDKDGNREIEVVPQAVAEELRPPLVTDKTTPGDWQKWMWKNAAGKEKHIGFEVKVDTLRHRFESTPCYFAWLRGPLGSVKVLGFAWSHIENVSNTSFTFRTTGFGLTSLDEFYVEWIGAQQL
jgi:hypothetical protein